MKNVRLPVGAMLGLLSVACLAQTRQVVVGPWAFTEGNVTSRTMVYDTVSKIAEHHGFAVVPQEMAMRSAESMGNGFAMNRGRPALGKLAKYASANKANLVIFGSASWHTRSIWVGTGPKTISTATIDLFVYNAKNDKITYQKRGVMGRSDEKESALKDIGAVLITPLITAVSGGPSTPREQRAVQIAIGRAIRPWIQKLPARN